MSKISVIIPYKPEINHNTLMWVIDGYQQQILNNHSLEIFIGFDGKSEIPKITNNKYPVNFYIFEKNGAAYVRNELVKKCDSDIVIFTNSDTRPTDNMVQIHADNMSIIPKKSLILGNAEYENNETIFDIFMNNTNCIFSYPTLKDKNWYPFFAGYSLNLSCRTEDFYLSNGFPEFLRPYAYEDIVFAHRFLGERNGIYYLHGAKVIHRHPMTFDQYLDREELLGLMINPLNKYYPESFNILMKHRSQKEITYDFNSKIQFNNKVYKNLYLNLNNIFSKKFKQDEYDINKLYNMHLPLKMLSFRLGFIRGLNIDDNNWQMRFPVSLWKKRLFTDE